MARSIGDAAAEGIESGFRLALAYNADKRATERADREDEDRRRETARRTTREDAQTRLSGLSAQEAMLKAEGAAAQASGVELTPEQQQDFVARTARLNAAKSKELTQLTGYDLSAQQAAGAEDMKALVAGQPLKPGQLTRALTTSTGRAPTDYVRGEKGTSPIEDAILDFTEGIDDANDKGDDERMLKGANAVFSNELRKGVGTPGAKGGTIIAKKIIRMVADPTSSPDAPKWVPVMRIYTNNGKAEQSGDEIRARREMEGAPEGATGHYDAPLTVNRSSDPNDPVRGIGVDEAMEFIGKHLEMVKVINTPEAQQQLKLDAEQGGWDPKQYLQALTGLGIPAQPKTTTKDTTIPAGGSVLRTTTDAQGRVISERRIEGNPKPTAAGRPGTMQQQIDAIDGLVEDGTLTEEEGAARKKALAARVSTGTKAQGLAGGGGGGKGGGGKANDKEIGRKLQYVKEQRLALDKKRDLIMSEYKADLGEAVGTKAKADLKTELQRKLAKIEADDESLRKNMERLEQQLDLGEDGPAPARGAGATIKFDKSGNRIGGAAVKFDRSGKKVE